MAYIWDTGLSENKLLHAENLNKLMDMIDEKIINYTCSAVNSSVKTSHNTPVTTNTGGVGYSPIYGGKFREVIRA